MIGAARQESPNRLYRIGLGGIDYVGCAELHGCLQPPWLEVNNHDPRRAGDTFAADRIKSHAPGTENDERVAGVHVSGVQDGAGAGNNAAAQQRSLGERHVFRGDNTSGGVARMRGNSAGKNRRP